MKAIVSGVAGYRDLVMDFDDAVVVIKALANAERYGTKYHPAIEATPTTEGRSSSTTKHIWSDHEGASRFSMRIMSDDEYRMAKLAGEPDD